jgi:predicted metal-dependent hydrolase
MDVEAMMHSAREEITGVGYDATHERVYPREYLEGIAHFNAGRYYDAHEIWEEIWLRSTDEAKVFYHMLIQAAVTLYHHERGNAHGARALYERVCEKLQKLPPVFMSLDVSEFACQLHRLFAELSEKESENVPSGNQPPPLIRLLRW